jgi:hypothetical protein
VTARLLNRESGESLGSKPAQMAIPLTKEYKVTGKRSLIRGVFRGFYADEHVM